MKPNLSPPVLQQSGMNDHLNFLNSSSDRYLESYVKYIRPESTDTSLFLNSLGKPMTDIGRCVSKFFEENGSLHVTTTTIR